MFHGLYLLIHLIYISRMYCTRQIIWFKLVDFNLHLSNPLIQISQFPWINWYKKIPQRNIHPCQLDLLNMTKKCLKLLVGMLEGNTIDDGDRMWLHMPDVYISCWSGSIFPMDAHFLDTIGIWLSIIWFAQPIKYSTDTLQYIKF